MRSIGKYLYRSNKKEAFSEFIFIILFIFCCGSSVAMNTPDYLEQYIAGGSIEDEILYYLLSSTFSDIGIHFNIFYLLFQGTGLLLLRNTARKLLGPHAWLFYILYMIFPMGENRSAIRNTFAACIIVYSIRYLLSDKRRDVIKFVLCVAIAIGFHRTAAAYLLFLLVYEIDKFKSSNILKSVLLIPIVLSFTLCFVPPLISALTALSMLYMEESELFRRGQETYLDNTSNYGFLYYWLYQICWIWMLYHFRKVVANGARNIWDYSKDHFIDVVIFMDVILLVMILGIKVNSNVFRIFQNIVPLNYMALIVILKSTRCIPRNQRVLLYMGMVVILFVGIQQTYVNYIYNIVPMFTHNWLLSFGL